MNQIIHIFLKDMRRFWAEIFISVAITAVFVCAGAYLWSGEEDVHATTLAILATLLAALVPVSWWVLIARVIHAERLVGDTQYWITRPYVWSNLLAAKLLFLVGFIYLPFFIAQGLLLAEAGFAPQKYVPGLLFSLLLFTGTAVLPLTAVATVTSSFARMTLTLLGIFVAFIAFTTIAALGFGSQGSGVESHVGSHASFALAVAACSAALVLQYAWRKVWITRGVLIALPVLVLAAHFFASKYDMSRMDRNFPIIQAAAPIQLQYTPNAHSFETSSFQVSRHAEVPIKIQLTESGVAEGYAVLPDAVRAKIKAPDGSHWESEWQGGDGNKFLPGESHYGLSFWVPIEVFDKFQSMPLSVHLEIALTQARAGNVSSVPMPLQRFAVPDFGVCSPRTEWAPAFGQVTGIHCVSALREPQLTYISTRWSDGTCSGSPTAPDAGVLGAAWVGSLDREPAQLSIASVIDLHIDLSNSQVLNTPGGKPRYLCAGTPIEFTQYKRVGRMQTSVDIQDFRLPKISVARNLITVTQ
jgi:hypothetical protein